MDSDELLIYKTDDGEVSIDVRMENETVWLTLDQMAVLFGKAKSTISEHIQNIFREGELVRELSIRKFGNSEFSTKLFIVKCLIFMLQALITTLRRKYQ